MDRLGNGPYKKGDSPFFASSLEKGDYPLFYHSSFSDFSLSSIATPFVLSGLISKDFS